MRKLLSLVLLLAAGAALGQTYPSKPVRYIVPFPPGGSADLIARAIAPKMSERLGQPIVVENRPGAGGMIGVDAVAKSAPDGYTIGLAAAGALSSNVHLYPSMPYDPAKDLAPISNLAMIPFFLVAHPSAAGSVKELIAQARAKPGALSYGHGGQGSTMHLAGELLNMLAKVNVQSVPYKGSAPVSSDVLGGQIPFGVVDVPSSIANVKAGKMRALAVTSKARIAAAPEVPTFEEAGLPGYEAIGWFGAVAPANTPREIVNQLNTAVRSTLTSKEMHDKMLAQGFNHFLTTPDDAGKFIKNEVLRFENLIKTQKITAE